MKFLPTVFIFASIFMAHNEYSTKDLREIGYEILACRTDGLPCECECNEYEVIV
jgi:hypothetical protein